MDEIELVPGDRLVLYTDGLIEVFNKLDEMLGVEGFSQLVLDAANVRRIRTIVILIPTCASSSLYFGTVVEHCAWAVLGGRPQPASMGLKNGTANEKSNGAQCGYR